MKAGSGFIVHFFSRDTVEHLAKGFDILSIAEFDEGTVPRKLFRVTLRKKERKGSDSIAGGIRKIC